MEISKKEFLFVVVCIAIIAFASGNYIHYALTLTPHSQNPQPRANLFLIYELFEGHSTLDTHNTITNIGENLTRNRHSGNISTAYGVFWISIGNATASASLTQLTSEYTRHLGNIANWTDSGDSAFNCTYKFQFAETQNINCAGSHWAGSGDNNMYACANFPAGAQTFYNGENLTVRWVYTYNAN